MSEIKDLVCSANMMELAEKTNAKVALTSEEGELVAELDARFKEIGKMGHDADHEISQFIRRTVNEEIDNAPSELVDRIFERGTLQEGDDFDAIKLPPKNTLIAHEAAKGGNVERSYLDVSVLTPVWKNRQV